MAPCARAPLGSAYFLKTADILQLVFVVYYRAAVCEASLHGMNPSLQFHKEESQCHQYRWLYLRGR